MFKNKTIVTIFCTIFIDLLGFGILIPVIPLLFASPTSPFYILPATISTETGYLLLGLLIAVFPLGQFFSTPILGQLSDRYGRKRVLALCLFGTALSYFVFAIGIVTKNIPLLFVARFFDGLTGGNISVAQAMIADISTPLTRAKNFGMMGAAFGLGFIFGPYIGGKLSDPHLVSWFSASTPFYFAGILALFNALSVLFILSETNKNMTRGIITWGKSLRNIMIAYRMKGVNVIFLTNFLFFAGFTFFTTFFNVFLINKFGFTQGKIGNFFAYIGLWSVFTQAVVTRIVAKHFSEVAVLRVGLVLSSFVILLYFLPREAWQLFLIPPIGGIINGLVMANIGSLLSRHAPETIRGEIMGIGASVQAMAQFIPAVLAGFIAASFAPETPLVIAFCVSLLGGLSFIFLYKKSL